MTWLLGIPARIKLALAGLVAVLATLAGVYAKGRGDQRAKEAAKDAKVAEQAHERMNDAPTLRDASDDDRREWLRDFAERNRRS